MQFKKATKEQSKLRLCLIGVTGGGKTYTALNIAKHFGGKVALIDTEHGSASLYADNFEFDDLKLDSFSPSNYVEGIKLAGEKGYDLLIIDSLSHGWAGKDGALEMMDKVSKRSQSGNSFSAWKEVNPELNKLLEAILSSPCHVIATLRAKMEYVLETNDKGKQVPRKIGLQPVFRDQLEFEFGVVADMTEKNEMIITKTRCSALAQGIFKNPGKEVADILKAWLSTGSAPTVKQKSEVAPVVVPAVTQAPPCEIGVAAEPSDPSKPSEPQEPQEEKYIDKDQMAQLLTVGSVGGWSKSAINALLIEHGAQKGKISWDTWTKVGKIVMNPFKEVAHAGG